MVVAAKVGYRNFPTSSCNPSLRAFYNLVCAAGIQNVCSKTAATCENLHHEDFVCMKLSRKDVKAWIYPQLVDYAQLCAAVMADTDFGAAK